MIYVRKDTIDGNIAVFIGEFYVEVCVSVSLYAWLYGNVYGTEWHEAGFLYNVL